MVYSAAYRGFQVAKRLYGYAKPVVQGKSFVSKFPPQHRKTVRTILKGSEIAFTGGLVSDILKDLNPDGTPNGDGQRQIQRNEFDKTHYRRRGRFKRRSKFDKSYCRCRPKRRYKRVQAWRR